ncbi:MAG TPA: hypothetical protein VMA13_06780 [Candidatus Saccharimonadales bacterium]|nr:hypothetical protein [Candidatus Saccharimonadales bacterium]
MSAETALFGAYREWRRLAVAGQRAIHKKDWNFLLECQSITRKLQSAIPHLARQARDEWRQQKLDIPVKEQELRAFILELMQLLESNKKLLSAARAAAISRRDKLQQAGRNLKRLESSYLTACASGRITFC